MSSRTRCWRPQRLSGPKGTSPAYPAPFDSDLEIAPYLVIGADLLAVELHAVSGTLHGSAGHAPGADRSDVHLHDDRADPGYQFPLPEDGQNIVVVGRMYTGYHRIVGQEEIAIVYTHVFLVVVLDHPGDVVPHEPDVNLYGGRLNDAVPLRRVEAHTELRHLADVRWPGHLFAGLPPGYQRGHYARVKQFSLDRVILQGVRLRDAGIAPRLLQKSPIVLKHLLESLSAVSDSFSLNHLDLLQMTFPSFTEPYVSHIRVHSSTLTCLPGGRNKVVAGASITAMPPTSFPGLRRSMSYIVALPHLPS